MLGPRSCLSRMKEALENEKTPIQMSNSKIKWSHVKKKLTAPAACCHVASGKFYQLGLLENFIDDTLNFECAQVEAVCRIPAFESVE